ncbi:MAG: hypothetical protein AMQ74_01765 [Candidatus Methanofastidiosum methylothiophilum]|uniref:Uncharacterized protein n=1 Tax=Candidatus Methanofastidiosum methylothiophilum TaxID=1705564 RepID=A0A150INU8_9EURY|nr:MAG: hypothetical protein AMQ74_01765 [Candidatus Methanofastidiosum methylthiophilus]
MIDTLTKEKEDKVSELILDLYKEVKDPELLKALTKSKKSIFNNLVYDTTDIEKLMKMKDIDEAAYCRGALPRETILEDLNKLSSSVKIIVLEKYSNDLEICNAIINTEKHITRAIKEMVLTGHLNKLLKDIDTKNTTKTIKEAIEITIKSIEEETKPNKNLFDLLIKNPDIHKETLRYIIQEGGDDTIRRVSGKKNLSIDIQREVIIRIQNMETYNPKHNDLNYTKINAIVNFLAMTSLKELFKGGVEVWKELAEAEKILKKGKLSFSPTFKVGVTTHGIYDNPILEEDQELFELVVREIGTLPTKDTLQKIPKERVFYMYKSFEDSFYKRELYQHLSEEHKAIVDIKDRI